MDGTASHDKAVCRSSRGLGVILLRAVLLAAATLVGLFISAQSASASDGRGLQGIATAVVADSHKSTADSSRSKVVAQAPEAPRGEPAAASESPSAATESAIQRVVATPAQDLAETSRRTSTEVTKTTRTTAATTKTMVDSASERSSAEVATATSAATETLTSTAKAVEAEVPNEVTTAAAVTVSELATTVDRTVATSTSQLTRTTHTATTALTTTVDDLAAPVTDSVDAVGDVVAAAGASLQPSGAGVPDTAGPAVSVPAAIDQGASAAVVPSTLVPGGPAAAARTAYPSWLMAQATTATTTLEAHPELGDESGDSGRSPFQPGAGGFAPAGSAGSNVGGGSPSVAILAGDSIDYFPSVMTATDFQKSSGKAEGVRPGQRPD